MLRTLHDQRVGGYRIHLDLSHKGRFFDQCDFLLSLVDVGGRVAPVPIFRGRFNAGRTSTHVPRWIDGEFLDAIFRNADTENVTDGLQVRIAERLGSLLPGGGRFWIAYEAFDHDGELQQETRAMISAQVPLLCTPIGHLLFHAECWAGLRDWYIPEGYREGHRKLQGNKAMDQHHAHRCAHYLLRDLYPFLGWRVDDERIRRAQQRGHRIAAALQAVIDGPAGG